jgi:acylphosphatase
MKKESVHLKINGYVQGVFFRVNTREIATGLGLTGWVKNMPNGGVEAVLEGPKDLLKEAVNWCHKGPPGATVTEVDEKWGEYSEEFRSFEIRW